MARIAATLRAAAVALCFCGPTLADGARIGEVKTVAGAVTIERREGALPAAPGAALRQSDVVRTGPDSSVGMTFTDNSRMSLGPSSELSLEKYRFGAGRPAFEARLNRGSLAAASGEIARSPQAMRVLTPTGVLGVRGTEFVVRVPQ